MECPIELKKHYRNGRIIPFIGAGVSMAVNWTDSKGEKCKGPSWQDLVDQAIKIMGYESPQLLRARGEDLQILEYFKLKNADQIAKLSNWLAKTLDPPDDALKQSTIHYELAQLDKCKIFYTTNYDRFLERAFELHNRPNRTIVVEQQMGLSGNDTEIVKFHGDLEHPDQIVMTESDYEKRLSLSTQLDLRLNSDLLGRVLLFVGYSFRDPNISYLFRLFMDNNLGKTGSLSGYRAYIMVPTPSDFEVRLFEERKIKVIPILDYQKEKDISDLLKDLRS